MFAAAEWNSHTTLTLPFKGGVSLPPLLCIPRGNVGSGWTMYVQGTLEGQDSTHVDVHRDMGIRIYPSGSGAAYLNIFAFHGVMWVMQCRMMWI